MDRSWILIGMMGAGKSAIGRGLAEWANREFIDTDMLLQRRFGRAVHQIFQIYGEDAFRGHETSVLRSLQPGANVISTGGGIVVREANWDELRRLGLVIYLRANPDTLISHLESSMKKRPLLEVDEWQEKIVEILRVREDLYEQCDIAVSIDGLDLKEALEKVKQAIQGVMA